MLNDGLYSRFPKPNYAIALHVTSLEAGKVSDVPGYALASDDSVDITVRGVDGHGSRPEATKDPIVIAAQLVLALQTIVSRERVAGAIRGAIGKENVSKGEPVMGSED
ncbi:MAG: peptidase dimerization domain-containing protein [Blastocatellia bacterium]